MKILLIITFLFLSACESSDKPQLTLTNEQAVYETVALKSINSMSKEFIILNKTNGIWFQKKSLEKLKNLIFKRHSKESGWFNVPEILLERIHSNNQKNHNINWSPIIVNGKLEPAEDHAPFKAGPLNETYSYYSFSKVAFSNDKKHALVKFTDHCLALCGGEWLVYLKFKEKEWKIIQVFTLWVSY